MAKLPKPAGSAPGAADLRELALRHLARFSATEAGLVRVLDRAIHRWSVRAGAEGRDTEADVPRSRLAARTVAADLVKAGVVSDTAFAIARAERLTRSGRSRRAVSAHLAGKGVPAEVAKRILPDAVAEFAAALAFARRRRIGPFAAAEASPARDLAAFARAGFPRDVAERALALSPEAAGAALQAYRGR